MLDSIKIKLPMESLIDINLNHFEKTYHTASENGEEVIKQKECFLMKEFLPFGVNNLILKECNYNQKIIVETSAKILKEDYHDLIHKNNILKLLANLNTSSISFKESDFLNSQILKLHVTNNLKVERNPQEYLDALYNYRVNHNYYVNHYKTGISFTRNVRTKHLRDRISFYLKFYEMQKDREMLRYVSPMIFKEEIRVESNLNHFYQMRKYLKIPQSYNGIKLCDALKSDSRVNFEMLNNITANYKFKLAEEQEHQDLSLAQLEKRVGREQIIEQFNYDMQLIMKYIRSKLGKNTKPSRYYKEYEKLLIEMISTNQNENINCISLIDELKFKLAE
ncbi:MAG: hypothetical protein ACOY90_13580 [Candidatus Zhuqueibacterota bacterium]